MAVDWTEEKVEVLTELWREGQSACQIAEVLGEGVTRNSVIGKANRLGLSKPSKSSVTRKQRTQEKVKAKLMAPEGGATILTLTASTCRWPIGDPGDEDFRFCGGPSSSEQPYCEYHSQLAYQTATTRERKRNRPNRRFG